MPKASSYTAIVIDMEQHYIHYLPNKIIYLSETPTKANYIYAQVQLQVQVPHPV